MTVRVFRSRRAGGNIEEIADYLAEFSPQALERAWQQLSEFPNSGAPGIRPGTRRLIVGDYILSYRRRDAGIEIFAVRHASRRDARL
jgi:plasmid stabilization system protein ParE